MGSWAGRPALVCVIAAALMLTPVGPASAAGPLVTGASAAAVGRDAEQGPNATSATEPGQLGPITDSEAQSYGCGSAAVGGAVLTAVGGYNELILVISGGVTTPSTTVGLAVAATGLVAASFCAVGALVTPGAVRLWKYYYVGMRPARQP